MKLNLKKEALVILSDDSKSLPAQLTPQVAGGGLPPFDTGAYCGDGQTSTGCTSLATCDGGPAVTETCQIASEHFACRVVD